MARRPGAIKYDGPFFEKDPRKSFRENVRGLMERVADHAEREAKQLARAGEDRRAPIRALGNARTSQFIEGRVRSLGGKRWEVTAVVSVSGAGMGVRQAVALKAAAAQVERVARPFRIATTRTKRLRRDVIGDLTKGMN